MAVKRAHPGGIPVPDTQRRRSSDNSNSSKAIGFSYIKTLEQFEQIYPEVELDFENELPLDVPSHNKDSMKKLLACVASGFVLAGDFVGLINEKCKYFYIYQLLSAIAMIRLGSVALFVVSEEEEEEQQQDEEDPDGPSQNGKEPLAGATAGIEERLAGRCRGQLLPCTSLCLVDARMLSLQGYDAGVVAMQAMWSSSYREASRAKR
jgi:hypothetical protein